jgi:hypothetical protein
MTKYHPLDVRHPDNRPYLSKNYLLDPPSMTHNTRYNAVEPARGRAARLAEMVSAPLDRGQRTSTATPSSPAQATAPWGSTPSRAAPVGATSSGPSRAAGILRTVFFLGVFGFIVLNQTDAFEQITAELRGWFASMGIAFPF